MMVRKDATTLILVSILVVLLNGVAFGGEVVLPQEVFFYYPVASVYGQNCAWVNPAGLASRQVGSMVIVTQRDSRLIHDWGTAVTMRVLSIAYRHIARDEASDHNEYVFAIGGGRQTRFGLSYRYIKDGEGYLNKRHLWNVGVMLQRTKNMSLGARIENLNRGRINGERSDVRFVYGLAARAYRDLVTVTFDVDMTHRQSLAQAGFRTGFEVRPKPGMFLYVDFDNHSQFNLGIRVNFGPEYVGHYHNFDRNADSYLGTTYVGAIQGTQPSFTIPKSRSLTLRLEGALPENPAIPAFRERPLKYFNYVDGIYKAADDRSIDRLYLHIGTLTCGMGKVEELRDAIQHFRSRGKSAYAFLASPGNLGYWLASSADSVIMPPVAQLNLLGLRANLVTYKGLMDKVGIEAEIERVDEYKTAPEPYMFDEPTEANRRQIDRMLDTLYVEMVAGIAADRGLPTDSVRALIDLGPLTSADAVMAGLIDTLLYNDEASRQFARRSGGSLTFRDYISEDDFRDRWGERARIALICADGEITFGRSGGKIGEHEMIGVLRHIRDDSSIKGAVLRINSPGGLALAADLIWHEIEEIAKKKPLMISMGNVAASGGYYITCVDSEIFADRSTLTGSIGIYGGKANITELLDKVGVSSEIHTRGKNAAIYSVYQPFTEEQRQQLRTQLRQFYSHFTELVGTSRDLSVDSIDALGRGQVWTGREAVASGLVDRIGGIYQAVEAVCDRLGTSREEVELVCFPEKYYFFKNPFDLSILARGITQWLGGEQEYISVLSSTEPGNIWYRMPYTIDIE